MEEFSDNLTSSTSFGDSSTLTSAALSSSYSHPPQTQISYIPVDDSILAFEPTIIKAKGGARLWKVEDRPECVNLCKGQLTVNRTWFNKA